MPRWLELQAEIDYLHFVLGQMHAEASRRTPIETMIDEATGFSKKRLADAQKIIEELEAKKKEFYSL